MGALFGAEPDTSKLEEQEAIAAAKEAELEKQLAARRKAASRADTKTLFSQVAGQASATQKKTTLGG